MEKREPLLHLQHIDKHFGAIQALADVEFDVYAGEVVGLVGDNGAGKSTLVKVIAGVHRPDAGQYFFDGCEITPSNPAAVTSLGIETVYQDLALCDNLDVVANLFLGRERLRTVVPGLVKTIDEIGMEREALHVIDDLHVHIPSVRSRVAELSGGQRQSVAVARAVMWNSRIVLLDEPTAALGVEQTRLVKELIVRLRERGLGVVVISHNLADVFDVTDRIIVLRLGRRVATFETRTTNADQVVSAITGV